MTQCFDGQQPYKKILKQDPYENDSKEAPLYQTKQGRILEKIASKIFI